MAARPRRSYSHSHPTSPAPTSQTLRRILPRSQIYRFDINARVDVHLRPECQSPPYLKAKQLAVKRQNHWRESLSFLEWSKSRGKKSAEVRRASKPTFLDSCVKEQRLDSVGKPCILVTGYYGFGFIWWEDQSHLHFGPIRVGPHPGKPEKAAHRWGSWGACRAEAKKSNVKHAK